METEITKGIRRNRFVYSFLRITFGWICRLMRNFSYEPCKIKGKTVLFLSNHNSDWDPLYMVIGMKRHMKFVASANILSGFVGRIIAFLSGPIPRSKGASADETVELIGKNLAAGISVAMFPEGNKSWDGRTCFISARTAVLLKENSCGLVTYRLDGDYLKTPRWARYKRRGRVTGRMVHEYLPEELQKMTEEEIYQAIVQDLSVDAYEFQKEHQYLYRGKKKAEGFENLAYFCPKCRKFGTIRTADDQIFCDCGLKMNYTDLGYLEDLSNTGAGGSDNALDGAEKLPENAAEWNRLQISYLTEHAEELRKRTEEPVRTDAHCTLYRTEDTEKQAVMTDGTVFVYGDRIECVPKDGTSAQTFYWRDVEKMGMFRNYSVYLTCQDKRYEIRRESGISGIFYFVFWRIMTGKELY